MPSIPCGLIILKAEAVTGLALIVLAVALCSSSAAGGLGVLPWEHPMLTEDAMLFNDDSGLPTYHGIAK